MYSTYVFHIHETIKTMGEKYGIAAAYEASRRILAQNIKSRCDKLPGTGGGKNPKVRTDDEKKNRKKTLRLLCKGLMKEIEDFID